MKKPKFEPLEFREMPEDEMIEAARSLLEKMRRRRTVREFSPREVPREVIENALRVAGSAPSGANRQPWHFVVVTDPSLKRQIREAAEEEERAFYRHRAPREWLESLAMLGTDEHKPFLEAAPCLIVVFGRKFDVGDGGEKRKNYYVSESVGIATGMLIMALHLSGLATLTHTPSPMRFLNDRLDRPDHERPFLILVAGYPADDAEVPVIDKYRLAEIATFLDSSG